VAAAGVDVDTLEFRQRSESAVEANGAPEPVGEPEPIEAKTDSES